MTKLINLITEKRYNEADEELSSMIPLILEKKLVELKKSVAAKMCEQMGIKTASQKVRSGLMEDEIEEALDPSENKPEVERGLPTQQQNVTVIHKSPDKNVTEVPKNNLKEEEQLDEARVKIVKARIRNGKIQRRKKISNVPGMTLRGGKLQRMSAAERRRRKMGARKAKVKRKAKMTRTLMKRKRSLQKRKNLGL